MNVPRRQLSRLIASSLPLVGSEEASDVVCSDGAGTRMIAESVYRTRGKGEFGKGRTVHTLVTSVIRVCTINVQSRPRTKQATCLKTITREELGRRHPPQRDQGTPVRNHFGRCMRRLSARSLFDLDNDSVRANRRL